MTKVYRLLLILTAVTMSLGCDKQVSDYIDGVRRVPRGDTESGQPEPMNFKITSGKLNSTLSGGTGGAITGTISPTNQVLTLGTDMAMSVTIGRARVVQTP